MPSTRSTPAPAPAAALLVVGSDLRGRAEEKLLAEAFGQRYLDYMRGAKRLVPGLY